MLLDLTVENFAIIDRLSLSLAFGLNALTGETGAGKSIIVDAVSALLGGKVDSAMLRAGAERARIEAIFQPPAGDETLAAFLEEQGFDPLEPQLFLSRDLHQSGRSVARVNGRAVPQAVVQQIGQHLVDIHGQSEHLSLLRSDHQLDLLDNYGKLGVLRCQVAGRVAELRRVRRELERVTTDERERARKEDLLRYQISEIKAANLSPGQEEELVREERLLANAQELQDGADAAYRLLYGSEGGKPIAALLADVERSLGAVGRIDPTMQEQQEAVAALRYQAEELGRALRSYRDRVESNPSRLEAVREHLDLIRSLKRKYGATIEEIIAFGRAAEEEMEWLQHRQERLGEWVAEERALSASLAEEAERLSQMRREAAERLAQAIEGELADLGLGRVRFLVALAWEPADDGLLLSDGERYAFGATGVDKVEFLIAPNPGEPPRPLAKIASGGETARVMLAIKNILAEADAIPTLVFDEIDAGIGGRSGWSVGQKLWMLARHHQVLCVTHLPQIACFADAHYLVEKCTSGGRTAAQVGHLSQEERVRELAVMLGAESQTRASQENAEELLQQAAAWRVGSSQLNSAASA